MARFIKSSRQNESIKHDVKEKKGGGEESESDCGGE